MEEIGFKLCNKCNLSKVLDNFYKSIETQDGYDRVCAVCRREKASEYRIKARKRRRSRWKERYLSDAEFREKIKAEAKKWKENNKEKTTIRFREYIKRRRTEDPLFRLRTIIRSRMYKIIKYRGYTKKSSSFEIIGCTFEFLKNYIESLWQPWMNWNNYGKWNGELNYGWDLDHIVPLEQGKSEEELLRLNHYTNLQPLCSHTNRYIKVNKTNEETFIH